VVSGWKEAFNGDSKLPSVSAPQTACPPPPRSVFWWDGAGGGPEGRPEGRVDIRGADTGEDGGAPDLVEAADTNAIPVKTWLSLGLRMLLMGLP
jgi:hypothetical protein